MKKKLLIFFVVCLFALSGFSINVYAKENMEIYNKTIIDHKDLIKNQKNVVDNWDTVQKTLNTTVKSKKFLATPGINSDLEAVIVDAVKNRKSYVNIEAFGLTTATFDTNALTYVLNDYPEFFYCGGIVTYYDPNSGSILGIAPHYNYDEETTA